MTPCNDNLRPRGCAAGFTLLELLVVVLIIGLLSGIVAPRLLGQVSHSEVTTARAQMDAIAKAVEAFRLDNGRYPSTQEGLGVLLAAPADAPHWRGPYLQREVPQDPWGMPYLYQSPASDGHDYQLTSYGRDKLPGGSGDDADIVR